MCKDVYDELIVNLGNKCGNDSLRKQKMTKIQTKKRDKNGINKKLKRKTQQNSMSMAYHAELLQFLF